MADLLITELIVDAKLANAGAAEFEQAARKIEQSSARAAAAVDALGQSIDKTSTRMAQIGQRGGANAFDPQIAAATKYKAAILELADAHEQTIRKMQSGAYNVFDAEAALGSIAAVRQGVQAGRVPEPGAIAAMPFDRFGANARDARIGATGEADVERQAARLSDARRANEVVTAAEVAPTVTAVLDSTRVNPQLGPLERAVAQKSASDPIIPGFLAKTHEKEAALVEPSIVQATERAISPGAVAEEASLVPAMSRIASAIEASRSAEAQRVAAIGSTGSAAIAPAAAAPPGAPPGGPPPPPPPNNPRPVTETERQSLGTIYGAEAQGASVSSIADAAALHTAATANQRNSEQSIIDAAAQHARGPSGVNVEAWLKERQPPAPPAPVNLVNVEEWNKQRQGAVSYLAVLTNLFSSLRGGKADLHGAAEATEGLASASEHAAGSGGRVRETFVLFREIFRGDFTRLLGSSTIELQRFGLLHLLLNPLVLGLGATAGALAYVAYKASEVDANLRSFTSTVKVMGDGSLTSAAELEHFTEGLKHTGVSGGDAAKTITEISRSGFVRPGQSTQEFAGLARDISQYNGAGAAGTPAAAEDLIKAFGGGTDEAIKFANSLHALSGAQIATIHDLDQHAHSGEALRLVYVAIRAAIPRFTEELSPLEKALLGVSTAWDEFTKSLAKSEFPSLVTSFIQTGIQELKTTIRELEAAANFFRSIKHAGSYPGSAEFDKDFPIAGPGSGVPNSALIPPPNTARSIAGASEAENAALAMVRQRENAGGQSDLLHYPAPGQEAHVRSLEDVERASVTKNSHAFGDYGFQPSTYRDAAMHTGVNPNDISPAAQDANALWLARTQGLNSTASWFESGARLGKPYPEIGGGAASASATPFRPNSEQISAMDLQNQKLKEELGINSQIAGVDREAVQERVRLQQETAKSSFFGDQAKYVDEGMIGFFRKRQELFESGHRLNEQEISDTNKIGQAYGKNAVEGLRAKSLVEAQQQIRTSGGAPSELPVAQRDIINRQAAAAISASRQQSTEAEPGIAAAERLGRAAFTSRAEEERVRVENEAALQTQDVLNKAILQGGESYIKEAAAIDENARAQFRRRDAATQGLEIGHQIQTNQDQAAAINLSSSLIGQGSIETQRQLGRLRVQQDIAQRFPAASPADQSAAAASGNQIVDLNAQLAVTQQHQQRINELFHGIAATVDGELGNALRNALIRTPLEAGEHIKNYWRELRASLKSTLGDIVSGIAQAAFIKPVTSAIASSIGLGQVAQQIGGFAIGGSTTVGGSGGTDSQHVHFMATPGERVVVLTPAQAAHADKTHQLPHFAEGGMLDVATGKALDSPSFAGQSMGLLKSSPSAVKPDEPREPTWGGHDHQPALSSAAMAALPRFAGGGEFDPATGETTYYNDAGQPFTVPDAAVSGGTAAQPPQPPQGPGFFGSAVDLARKGLASEAGFLSAKAADQPLLGLDTGTGEITGRIPAIADFMQQGLAGGAPAGTLSAGMKLGRAAGATEEAGSAARPDFVSRVIDTAHPPENPEDFRGFLRGAAWYDKGRIEGVHVTDDPSVVSGTLKNEQPIADSRADKFGDIGRGLYFSAAPQIWMSRSTGKWDFLDTLTAEQGHALGQSLRSELDAMPAGYISQGERANATRDIENFASGHADPSVLTTLASQPYNISFWKPDYLEGIGIKPSAQPAQVPMAVEGKFAQLTRTISESEASHLKESGYDGAFTQSSMGTMPQFVVWNNDAVHSFGDWQRPPTPAASPGIIAYHGSPHDFEKFDSSKIGSGEGAQAYGHGLYFAENEAVATDYRDRLSSGRASDDLTNFLLDNAGQNVSKPEIAAALSRQDSLSRLADDPRAVDAVHQLLPILPDSSSGATGAQLRHYSYLQDAIDKAPRKMYEVGIHADPESFLHWDKPLSEQSEQTQKALSDAWLAHPQDHARQTGAQIYGAAADDPMAASEKLRDAGIPGIRYLDQGSRVSPEEMFTVRQGVEYWTQRLAEAPGEPSYEKKLATSKSALAELEARQQQGTSNYVVFDPANIEILRKYGLAGPPSLAQEKPPADNAQAAPTEPAAGGFFDAQTQPLPMLAEGGSVAQTGAAIVHAGEVVLPTDQLDHAFLGLTQGAISLSQTFAQTTPHVQTLSQTISELSTLFSTAKSANTLLSPIGGGAAGPLGNGQAADLSNSQITYNVNGISTGATLTGPAQGGIVNSTGNVTTVQGGAAGAATPTPPEPVAAAAGSEQQIQNSLSASAAPLSTAAASPPIESFLSTITSAAAAAAAPIAAAAAGAQPSSSGAPTSIDLLGPADFSSGSIAPQQAVSPAVASATGVATPTAPAAAAAPVAQSLTSPSTIGGAVSAAGGISSLFNQPGLLPSFLNGSGGTAVGGFLSNPFGLFATPATAANAATGAAATEAVPGIFGTTATFGSFLTGAGAGFGAGALLNNILGGNPVGGTAGSAGGSLAGAAIGSLLLPGLGTLAGGLIGGLAGGGLGGLIGGPPAGQSAGAVVGSTGQIAFNDTGGSAANISASNQVSQQIASFVRALGQLTNAQGQPIGNVSTNAVVSSNNRTGINVTGTNIAGGQFGQDAANAVTQTELQIIQSLTNVSGTLSTVLKNINDPSQLQNAVQFVDVYDKLKVTSAELTASLNGNSNAIGPFSQALTQVNSTFAQLTSQAQQFGVSTAPISDALTAVTKILNQDFKINVAEALSTAIDGGNDFIASLVKIHQTFEQNKNDAAALASGVPTGVTGFASGTMGSAGGTPPGWILVGERGPEWMFQPGGATVLPNGQQPSDVPDPTGRPSTTGGAQNISSTTAGGAALVAPPGRSFAQGIGAGDIAGQVPGIGSLISEASGGPSLLGAAGGVLGISSGTLSTIGDVLPIAGPLIGGALAAVTGHPLQGAFGTAASLIGFALGGPIGGVIGGLVGLLGNLFGPKPSNNASGDLVDLSSGVISGFQSAGDKNADQNVAQISAGISAISTAFQAATGGTISGAVNVQDGRRDGIKTSYSGPAGKVDEKWGDVSAAIGQFGLAIAHNLQGIDPALQAQLGAISDPNQLIPAIENFTGKGIDLGSPTPGGSPAASSSSSTDASSATSSAATQTTQTTQTAPPASLSPDVTAAVAAATASQAANNNAVAPQLVAPAPATAATNSGAQTAASPVVVTAPSDIAALETQIAAQKTNALVTSLLTGVETSSPVPPGYDPTQGGLYGQYDAYGTYIPATGTSSFAGGTQGTQGTPPGWILVGEQGPEWLLQPGGATVLPNGVLPPGAPSPAGRSFAAGTDWGSYSISVPAGWSGTVTIDAATAAQWSKLGAKVTPIGGSSAPGVPGVADYEVSVSKPASTNLGGTSGEASAWAGSGASVTTLSPPTPVAAPAAAPAGASSSADGTVGGTPLAQINSAIAGTETAQAGPVLAGLGIDQLTTVIQSLGAVAPEIAAMAQNLINSGNALPDILTQGIQALTDPLDFAVEKEKAIGVERVAIATQTGEDLVKAQQLTSANLIQAVLSNIGNTNALNAIVYPGNTKALETLQAAPTLAGLSGQQLTALVANISAVAPDLAALAQQQISGGTALPDTITQALEGVVNPLKLALQQQAAQAAGRTQVADVTAQDFAQVAALNSASTIEAVISNISNPTSLQALVANGSPQGLAQLQAGPVIAGLGTDQLSALLTAIGNAAPQLTNMINALVASGRALPDALVQATQAITNAGLLAVEKAQALGFEQVQGAAQTGQSIPEAQQLAAAETAQATAQATNTQLPINGLPDWVTQLEEAVVNPLQLAIQKERAAGAERVLIAEASGADLVRVQQENADAVAQIWYQATQQLTSLRNDLTTGSLSGLTAANQVTASIQQFNTVLGLVQGGNTNFISELSTAGQNAVQAAQQAYGNGPQTASVRQQVYQAISPFLVSASGYPTSGATAIAAGATTSSTATGTPTDLQSNTTALQSLTTAITSTLGSSGAITGGSGGTVSAAAPASGTPGAAAAGGSTFSPDLTASVSNLLSKYNGLSPAMQAIYNGVVGTDNAAGAETGTTYNSGAGLGNKVELAALLQGYQGLSPAAAAQYDEAVTNNPAYSNTASGVASKLSLVESLYPQAPAPVTPVSPVTSGTGGGTPANLNITSNPVTGQSFTGNGITAVTPNFPTFPSASTLSNALADAIASHATAGDWATINQAVQAGILNPANQPGYALVIAQAQQFAAGQAINPSAGLSQALSDAVNGTPTLQEWALINQAVNAGILSPTAQPQYATVIQQARKIANAQAISLSQIPNNQTAYNTVINGLPAFASGTESTPPGMVLVGEKGPEWYHPANDNMPWRMVGAEGPELISQPGGATILPFPVKPPQRFAEGTSDWQAGRYAWASGAPTGTTTDRTAQLLSEVLTELQANRKQMMGGQLNDDQNAKAGHELTRKLVQNTGPNLSPPARRAVG